ncbi:glycine betaine ABC transporter substrate-binding protein [Calidifontibacillus erzurumensis]|uniref:Glycine betaine ABC transporter substrate-binding protein n=1 Tax=Calidifontibacillus erzurumensis TaxID=2741433 RepID=A0A8J8GGE7_9BACI|nr:glycine betaine ABC transporter substrate-binding protein [Calidifontibacillus erzurumensis]NSL53177.1 glycine betaine ABC transporter substrate-binding protein [Calidifontibacillus erzurumensis]
MKKLMIVLIGLMLISSLVACNSSSTNVQTDSSKGSEEVKGKVVVGGKDFTEQQILSKIASIYLKENGYEVEEASNMGSTVVRSALENGQIDMYWEYTGTALVVFQKQQVETDPEAAYEKVKETDKANGLAWLNKANFNNTYAILMKQEKAEELGIHSISDLAKYMNEKPDELKFASNAEFYAREDGIKGLEKHYGFKFPAKNVVKMDSGLLYNALKDGQVDVSVGFATDGRIKGFNLVALEDDQLFFPAYNAAPVVRQEIIDKYPEVAELLNTIAGKLDTETMMELNYSVDVEHKEVSTVAREWLQQQGLVQ